MQVTVESYDPARAAVDVLAVPLFQIESDKPRLAGRYAAIDRALGGRISATLRTGDFRGKRGESLLVYPEPGAAPRRILLVGLGPEASADAEALRRAAGAAVGAAAARRGGSVAVLAPFVRRLRPPALGQALSEGAILAGYRYDAYHTRNEDGRGVVSSVALVFDGAAAARAARPGRDAGVVLGESQNLARDLSNAPANALPPAALALEAERVAKEVGLRSHVLDVAELRRRKLGAILAVGQGSENPPRMIVLEHRPHGSSRRRTQPSKKTSARRRVPKICLIGKGITFDSGGISIKPGAGMHEMKHDMSGGAAVIGALRAAALLKLPLHVVGIVAAAENMPSGAAYRPGDVVTAGSGKTIEVLNTDAEGRLILIDTLTYAQRLGCTHLVDAATLTGAIVVALGDVNVGAFTNNEAFLGKLLAAAKIEGEKMWQMPMDEEYKEQLKSQFADLHNIGGRPAGSITAATFLRD
ncbi:MAG TPA: leucyl aminopeptidase, partial [Deltaproteobacteria bacterium]|nr:leucyl aminopeptidase [Deltaproteobacteria bacterium]